MSIHEDVAYAASIKQDEDAQWNNADMKNPVPSLALSTSNGKSTGDLKELEQQITAAGKAKYSRLGWKQLTLMLVVEAIDFGSLSMPSAFATLGMVAGLVCCVGIGLIAIYTSHMIGQVKLAFPSVQHYGDVGTLLMGRFGYEVFSAMFLIQLVFFVGSHCLTGAIALCCSSEVWIDLLFQRDTCAYIYNNEPS